METTKDFLRPHIGSISIALAIVIAAAIYGYSSRYEVIPASPASIYPGVLDRWTGSVRYPGPN